MSYWSSYTNWYGGGGGVRKQKSRKFWSGGSWDNKKWNDYQDKEAAKDKDKGYQVCKCGQWKYSDRKFVNCDRCGQAWESECCGEQAALGGGRVDDVVASLGALLGADEETVRGALASLLPLPAVVEEKLAKECEFFQLVKTAKGKMDQFQKKTKDAQGKCDAAKKKFEEAQANLEQYKSAAEEAEAIYRKAKADWWKAYPDMAQNKESFATGRYADDDEDVFNHQQEGLDDKMEGGDRTEDDLQEEPKPAEEQPGARGAGSSDGSRRRSQSADGTTARQRSRSRERTEKEKAEDQSAARMAKRWADDNFCSSLGNPKYAKKCS